MFKLFIALCLFVAIQGALPVDIPGGFTDRPDLVKSSVTRTMVNLAINELAKSENLEVSPVRIVSVATQVVNGVNYEILFTASSAGDVLVCRTKIYQPIQGVRSVSSVNCA